ncbi:MAG: hypothetical protein QOE79_66 [Sphingomonadales bacterium]|jgi:hypothetical protein|nr:hypothetical protein [Sphingomonadales bacterium]
MLRPRNGAGTLPADRRPREKAGRGGGRNAGAGHPTKSSFVGAPERGSRSPRGPWPVSPPRQTPRRREPGAGPSPRSGRRSSGDLEDPGRHPRREAPARPPIRPRNMGIRANWLWTERWTGSPILPARAAHGEEGRLKAGGGTLLNQKGPSTAPRAVPLAIAFGDREDEGRLPRPLRLRTRPRRPGPNPGPWRRRRGRRTR